MGAGLQNPASGKQAGFRKDEADCLYSWKIWVMMILLEHFSKVYVSDKTMRKSVQTS